MVFQWVKKTVLKTFGLKKSVCYLVRAFILSVFEMLKGPDAGAANESERGHGRGRLGERPRPIQRNGHFPHQAPRISKRVSLRPLSLLFHHESPVFVLRIPLLFAPESRK